MTFLDVWGQSINTLPFATWKRLKKAYVAPDDFDHYHTYLCELFKDGYGYGPLSLPLEEENLLFKNIPVIPHERIEINSIELVISADKK